MESALRPALELRSSTQVPEHISLSAECLTGLDVFSAPTSISSAKEETKEGTSGTGAFTSAKERQEGHGRPGKTRVRSSVPHDSQRVNFLGSKPWLASTADSWKWQRATPSGSPHERTLGFTGAADAQRGKTPKPGPGTVIDSSSALQKETDEETAAALLNAKAPFSGP